MENMTKEDIKKTLNRYTWYHRIQVTPDISTNPIGGGFDEIWDFILRGMQRVDFKNKRVLDVGCGDGLFSFEAERRGANEVIGIENSHSLAGATEFLIPFFKSNVKMYELNVIDLTPQEFGSFDVILFFGVLYHLRYPFWGLKRIVDCLSDKGILLVESGMLIDGRFANNEFLYCPVERSPYEKSSCSFFNEIGLCTTLRSLNCKLLDSKTLRPKTKFQRMENMELLKKSLSFAARKIATYSRGDSVKVGRQFFVFQKDVQSQDTLLNKYWNATHFKNERTCAKCGKVITASSVDALRIDMALHLKKHEIESGSPQK
jgi:SAM-dependent methyltransferase